MPIWKPSRKAKRSPNSESGSLSFNLLFSKSLLHQGFPSQKNPDGHKNPVFSFLRLSHFPRSFLIQNADACKVSVEAGVIHPIANDETVGDFKSEIIGLKMTGGLLSKKDAGAN